MLLYLKNGSLQNQASETITLLETLDKDFRLPSKWRIS